MGIKTQANRLFCSYLKSNLSCSVYVGEVPHTAKMPYIVVQSFDAAPNDSKTNLGLEIEVQIKAIDENIKKCSVLSDEVYDLLHNHSFQEPIQTCRYLSGYTFGGNVSFDGIESVIPQTIMKFNLLIE